MWLLLAGLRNNVGSNSIRSSSRRCISRSSSYYHSLAAKTTRTTKKTPAIRTSKTPSCCAAATTTIAASSGTRRNYRATTTAPSFDRNSLCGTHGSYIDEYTESIEDPEAFWSRAAGDVMWYTEPKEILDYDPKNAASNHAWFKDGELNACYNCLDVHVDEHGRGDLDAIIYDSPLTNTKKRITYKELLHDVSKLAAALRGDCNVQKGDRVVIYMPMIPEAVVAMLACSRIGATHSVVFGGFAAKELAARIVDCKPKVVVSASAGIEPGPRVVPYKPLLDEALRIAQNHLTKPTTVQNNIIVQRNNIDDAPECAMGPNDVDYEALMSSVSFSSFVLNGKDPVLLPSNHPQYILYTSGTTGPPKGIVRDTGGHCVALKYSMGAFYNARPGDVFWTASDIGWVVGHSYIVYGPLLQGCTTVLYEGKPVGMPAEKGGNGAFWRVIEEYGVKTLFTAPTAFRAMKQLDPSGELITRYDASSLEALFLAGEHSDPDTIRWCENAFKKGKLHNVPIIDHWWQTELGWPAVGNAMGLGHIPVRHGACAAPVPGYNISFKNTNDDTNDDDDEDDAESGGDEDCSLSPQEDKDAENNNDTNNTSAAATTKKNNNNKNVLGDMVIKLPLPPGTLLTLYKNNKRYVESYLRKYPGYYNTGDAGYADDEGYVYIMGRTDDVINVAGHRLSTGTMEEILMDHGDVADCAVVPMNDPVRGQVPIGFVILNAASASSSTATTEEETKDFATIERELIQSVRDKLGAIANFKKVASVRALPKTRSGKILRGTMTKIANGEPYKITPTIDNPKIFEYLEPEIQKLAGRRRE